MKLFGSIKELVSAVFRKDSQEITLRPNQSTTYTAARDVQLPPGDSAHVLTSAAGTQTLTNKTIDGDDNTVQDLALTSLKTVLADASKVLKRDASGIVVSSNSVPNNSALVTTDATQTLQNKTLDVTNVASLRDDFFALVDNGDNTKVLTFQLQNQTTGTVTTLTPPAASGVLVSRDSTDTLTNKTIDGDNNTVQDLALTSLKTVIGDANKVIRRDASGVVISGNSLPNSSAIVTVDSTDTLSNKTVASPTVTGTLLLQNPSGEQPVLALSEDPDNGTNKINIQAPATLAADYTLTLPVDDGTSGQVLQTDGSGVLSWVNNNGGGSGTYTPTISSKSGTLASGVVTSFTAQYSQVGTVVTVSGKLTVQATGGGDGSFALSLPVSTAFTAEEQAGGTWSITHPSIMFGIKAIPSSSTVNFTGNFGTTASQSAFFIFSYRVI